MKAESAWGTECEDDENKHELLLDREEEGVVPATTVSNGTDMAGTSCRAIMTWAARDTSVEVSCKAVWEMRMGRDRTTSLGS